MHILNELLIELSIFVSKIKMKSKLQHQMDAVREIAFLRCSPRRKCASESELTWMRVITKWNCVSVSVKCFYTRIDILGKSGFNYMSFYKLSCILKLFK